MESPIIHTTVNAAHYLRIGIADVRSISLSVNFSFTGDSGCYEQSKYIISFVDVYGIV